MNKGATKLNFEFAKKNTLEQRNIVNGAMGLWIMSAPNVIEDQAHYEDISPFERFAYEGEYLVRKYLDDTDGDGYGFQATEYFLNTTSSFDFNFYLSRHAEYVNQSPVMVHEIANHKNVLTAISEVITKYSFANTPIDPCLWRIQQLHFHLWYTVLGLNVERVNEFEHWLEMIECACCPIQLENVSICIRLLGGQFAEDRETYLAKLRPHFMTHLQRVKNKAITCDCGTGLDKS